MIEHYKFKTKPYEHQLKALDVLGIKKHLHYLWKWVQGKSKVLIDNIALLYDKGDIQNVLIIAPKGVYQKLV